VDRPSGTPANAGQSALSGETIVNGVVAFTFAASGPLAVILTVGTEGRLTQGELASWVFAAFTLNALVTLFFSLRWRQPLVFFWTIPGTVLVGEAMAHLPFAEIVGAYLATGALMLVLGASGLVGRVMGAVPLPIVMGMVAGVFLKFGLDWVKAFQKDGLIAVVMTAAFLGVSAVPGLAKRLPPLLVALAAGAAAVWFGGTYAPALGESVLVAPVLQTPQFSWRAMLELVVPLAITVLVVQNGQGVAVVRAAGHAPPVDGIAAGCGLATMLFAWFGASPTCLTGPANAIVSASKARETHYAAACVVGVLALGFGLFSPLFTGLLLATPPAFIATLAGLAMLRVLQTAFATAFQGRCGQGALVTFLVTVAGIPILGIGAAFWGLVFGYATSWLIERDQLRPG
jgi:benzoate membrane transport protein